MKVEKGPLILARDINRQMVRAPGQLFQLGLDYSGLVSAKSQIFNLDKTYIWVESVAWARGGCNSGICCGYAGVGADCG